MATFIPGSGFAGDGGLQYGLPGAAVGLQVNRILDGIPHYIAVVFLLHQGGPFQADANGGKLGIGECVGPGGLAGNLRPYADFIFSTGNTLNIVLCLRTRSEFPGHANEVLRTICILKRSTVEINIFPG